MFKNKAKKIMSFALALILMLSTVMPNLVFAVEDTDIVEKTEKYQIVTSRFSEDILYWNFKVQGLNQHISAEQENIVFKYDTQDNGQQPINGMIVEIVKDINSTVPLTTLTTNAQGQLNITSLEDGSYYGVEKTIPEQQYNTASETKTIETRFTVYFTVKDHKLTEAKFHVDNSVEPYKYHTANNTNNNIVTYCIDQGKTNPPAGTDLPYTKYDGNFEETINPEMPAEKFTPSIYMNKIMQKGYPYTNGKQIPENIKALNLTNDELEWATGFAMKIANLKLFDEITGEPKTTYFYGLWHNANNKINFDKAWEALMEKSTKGNEQSEKANNVREAVRLLLVYGQSDMPLSSEIFKITNREIGSSGFDYVNQTFSICYKGEITVESHPDAEIAFTISNLPGDVQIKNALGKNTTSSYTDFEQITSNGKQYYKMPTGEFSIAFMNISEQSINPTITFYAIENGKSIREPVDVVYKPEATPTATVIKPHPEYQNMYVCDNITLAKAFSPQLENKSVSIGIKKIDNTKLTEGQPNATADKSAPLLAGAEFDVYYKNSSGNHTVGKIITTNSGSNELSLIYDTSSGRTTTYYYKETKAPDGYRLDTTEHSFTIDSDGHISAVSKETDVQDNFVFVGNQAVGKLTINKVVSGDATSASDKEYTFTVTGPNSYKKTGIKVKVNQPATLNDLVPGTYTVTEDKTGAQIASYDLQITSDKEGGKVTVTGGQTASVTFTNTYTEHHNPVGSLTIRKVVTGAPDTENGKEYSFTVTGPSYNETHKVKANESITIHNLTPGEYTVTENQEDAAIEGYSLKVTVDNQGKTNVIADNTATVTYTNAYTENHVPKGSLVIQKVATGAPDTASDKEYTFTVTGPNGYSNENVKVKAGQATTLDNLTPGEYTVKENEASANIDGYTVNITVDNAGKATVIDGGSVTVTYTNIYTQQKGKLTITKTVQGAPSSASDKTFTFRITGPGGYNSTETLTAGETKTINDLVPGTYTVTEENADIEGYTLNVSVDKVGGSVEVEANQTASVTYTNKYEKNPAKVDLTLTKVSKADGSKVLKEVVVTLEKDGAALENYTNFSSTDGKLVFEDLLAGSYTLKEITAPKGYIKTEVLATFVITEDGEITSVDGITSLVQATQTPATGFVENTPNEFVILKVESGSENKPVAGAKIHITGPDGYNEDATTNAEGKVILSKLAPGTYTYVETKAPDGYILDETPHTFVVKEDGNIDESNSTDKFTNAPTEVTITKTDLGSTPLKGAHFEIYNDKQTKVADGITGDDGVVKFYRLPAGTYTYVEVKAPDGYKPNTTPVEFTIDETGKVALTVTNTPNEVVISKTDATGETFIHGAVIEIKNNNGDLVEGKNHTTGADGKITLKALPAGTYTMREVEAPAGYVLDSNTYTFTVSEDGTVTGTTTIKNSEIEVTLSKTDLVTGKGVPGAVIEVLDSEGQPVAGSPFTTDDNGKIILKALPAGTYTFHETIAPDGYILNEEVATFTVDENGEVTGKQELTNAPRNVTLTKTDLVTGEGVPGAVIEIKDSNEEPIKGSPFTTNDKGEITIERLLPGTYTFKETVAPDGYVINEEEFTFTVDEDGKITGTVTLTNKPIDITLTKTDLVNGEGVPGATIEILDENNEVVATEVTDKDGKITLHALPAGTYTFHETVAPDGYILNEEIVKFTVKEDGTVEGKLTLTNKPTEVTLTKTDLVDGTPVPGATIEIRDKDGKVVQTAVTDDKGQITLRRLPAGTYTFHETVAPDGYILNEEEVEFTIAADGTVTGKTTLTNKPIEVVIHKTDIVSGKGLPGAIIEVRDANGNNVAGSPFTTDENGEITLKKLPAGTYTFKEVVAPNGYILSVEECKFSVDIYGQVTGKTTLTNAPTEVVLQKVDSENNNPLANARFEIRKGNTVISIEQTDKDGKITLRNLPVGTYSIKEVQAPAGYKLDTTTYSFSIAEDGTVSGTTTLKNTKIVVELFKKDLTTGEVLGGAEFVIKDANGNTIATATTGKDGKITINKLPAGKYTLEEKKAPDGYELNKTVYSFTVTEDGKVEGTTTIYNKKLPTSDTPSTSTTTTTGTPSTGTPSTGTPSTGTSTTTPDKPVQTGDALRNNGFIFLMAGLAVMAGGIVLISKKKKKDE